MKKNYKLIIIFSVVIVFFIMLSFFYDKSNKNKTTNVTTYDRKVMDIKNTAKSDEVCTDSKEEFYQDDNYKYSFPCMMSSKIIVYFNDGTQEYVRDALNNKDITISDLDRYSITYYKEVK